MKIILLATLLLNYMKVVLCSPLKPPRQQNALTLENLLRTRNSPWRPWNGPLDEDPEDKDDGKSVSSGSSASTDTTSSETYRDRASIFWDFFIISTRISTDPSNVSITDDLDPSEIQNEDNNKIATEITTSWGDDGGELTASSIQYRYIKKSDKLKVMEIVIRNSARPGILEVYRLACQQLGCKVVRYISNSVPEKDNGSESSIATEIADGESSVADGGEVGDELNGFPPVLEITTKKVDPNTNQLIEASKVDFQADGGITRGRWRIAKLNKGKTPKLTLKSAAGVSPSFSIRVSINPDYLETPNVNTKTDWKETYLFEDKFEGIGYFVVKSKIDGLKVDDDFTPSGDATVLYHNIATRPRYYRWKNVATNEDVQMVYRYVDSFTAGYVGASTDMIQVDFLSTGLIKSSETYRIDCRKKPCTLTRKVNTPFFRKWYNSFFKKTVSWANRWEPNSGTLGITNGNVPTGFEIVIRYSKP